MRTRKLAADVEAEAGAGHALDTGLTAAPKGLEHRTTKIARDADPVVGDANHGPAVVADGADRDPGRFARVRDRVVDEDVHDVAELAGVGHDGKAVRGALDCDLALGKSRARTRSLHRRLDYRAAVDHLARPQHHVAFESRDQH